VDEFVASFVGVETILAGKVTKRELGTIIASISDREVEAVGDFDIGEDVALCVRPENVTLAPHLYREVTSARNVFNGRIVRIIPMGLFNKVELDCGFPLVAYITQLSLEHLGLKEGKEVRASFKATATHVVRRRGS
jgi:tungstate transport system ATP-binding protein